MDKSLEAGFEQRKQPIIIKDTYEVSGSEMAHIGWVEVKQKTSIRIPMVLEV